jgi:hypothetical protein
LAVALAVLQIKQIRINRQKLNNKKHTTNNTKHGKYKYTHNQNTHTIVKTPPHTLTHTLQNKLKQEQHRIQTK